MTVMFVLLTPVTVLAQQTDRELAAQAITEANAYLSTVNLAQQEANQNQQMALAARSLCTVAEHLTLGDVLLGQGTAEYFISFDAHIEGITDLQQAQLYFQQGEQAQEGTPEANLAYYNAWQAANQSKSKSFTAANGYVAAITKYSAATQEYLKGVHGPVPPPPMP